MIFLAPNSPQISQYLNLLALLPYRSDKRKHCSSCFHLLIHSKRVWCLPSVRHSAGHWTCSDVKTQLMLPESLLIRHSALVVVDNVVG